MTSCLHHNARRVRNFYSSWNDHIDQPLQVILRDQKQNIWKNNQIVLEEFGEPDDHCDTMTLCCWGNLSLEYGIGLLIKSLLKINHSILSILGWNR